VQITDREQRPRHPLHRLAPGNGIETHDDVPSHAAAATRING
jgi:hypothetical protein